MATRRRIIAGNWKMNTTLAEATVLARGVADVAAGAKGVDVVVIPPTCFLQAVREAIGDAPVGVGAQNLHSERSGAFTGETSGPMLDSLGIQYVLCGHSERRHLFGESAEWVGQKVIAAHKYGLTPILCVGETLEEREEGDTETVVAHQLDRGLAGLERAEIEATILAYEPVWAIGTGRTASPEQAQDVHAFIRRRLAERYDQALADVVRIQYGGSVKASNASGLLGQPDIDGALVGGASLDAGSFAGIVTA